MTTDQAAAARRILDDLGVRRADGTHPPKDADQGDEVERRSWRPVDLTEVLEGRYTPPMPTVGARSDGVGLFYPGRMHSIAAESEAGKTWLMLASCAIELERGNGVVYVDFEDDEGGVVGRLLALQIDPQDIRDRFGYVRPEAPIRALGARDDLAQALGDLRPTLATLDGVTEGMVMHGLDPLSNADVAEFGRILPRTIAEHGPAVVTLDHVTKDREGRGRYALGAVHKLNGLNGAAYSLDSREPFGVGVTGRSGLKITKDRPGQLRKHAVHSAGGARWFADLVGKSHDANFVEVSIETPLPQESSSFRPTHVMGKVTRLLDEHPGGLSKNSIETMIGGRAQTVRTALELLVSGGYVQEAKRGQALIHTLIKPYGDEE